MLTLPRGPGRSDPPIALDYMQGLNTTPVHGHAALFGVYGMLGIGLMLFSLHALDPVAEWKNGLLQFGFWATNSGLMLMVALSLLPVGLMQTWASVETGYWYAQHRISTDGNDSDLPLAARDRRHDFSRLAALAAFVIGVRTGGTTQREPFQLPTSARATSR